MKKKQLMQAVIFLASKYGREIKFKAIIESEPSIQRILELIIYELFYREFDKNDCTIEELICYTVIHDSVKELREYGEIKFIESDGI